MPKSLAQAREKAGVPEKLAGKELKDYLIEHEIRVKVTTVQADDGDYGPSWSVMFEAVDPMPAHIDTMWFPMAEGRDDDMSAMGDATLADPYGPLVLTRRGKRGFYQFRDAE